MTIWIVWNAFRPWMCSQQTSKISCSLLCWKKETTIQLTALLLYHQVFFDDPPWLPKLLGFQNALRAKANSSSFLWFEPTRLAHVTLFHLRMEPSPLAPLSCHAFDLEGTFHLKGSHGSLCKKTVEWTPKHMRYPSLKLSENMFPSTLVSRPNLEVRIYHFGSLLQQDCKERSATLNVCFPLHRLTPDWDLTPVKKKKGPNGCDTINGGFCWLHDPTACHSGFFTSPPRLPSLLALAKGFWWTCVCVFDFFIHFIHCFIWFLSLMHTPSMLWLCLRSTNWLHECVHFWNQSCRFSPEPVLSAVPSCHVPAGLWTSAK